MEAEEQRLHVTFVARNGHRRYDPAWKDRLVSEGLEAGVSVSRLALDHGVNANLLRKWIKQRGPSRFLPQPSPSTFIPVEIASTANLAVPRQGGMAETALPVICDVGRGPVAKGPPRGLRQAKVSASLPNGVKLTLECGDLEALTAIIGALGHVQTGR